MNTILNTNQNVPVTGLVNYNYLLILLGDGTLLFKSEKWNLITGERDSLNSIYDLVNPSSIPDIKNTMEHLSFAEGAWAELNLSVINSFGQEIRMDAKACSYKDEGVMKILVLADDVTDKIRLTNRLLFGFENASDVIYELDIVNQRYNYVSPACFEVFEITPEQALNSRPGSLEHKIHPEDYSEVHNHFKRICKLPGKGKQNHFIRYRLFHSKLGLKHVIDRHTVFYNSQSQPCLIIGNIRDITDLQLSNEQIQRSEKMFKSIVESSIDIITMLDRNGVIKFVSPSIEPVLGYKPEDIINRHLFEIIDPSMHGVVSETMNKLLENPGKVIQSEMYFKYANGRDVYLKSNFINYLDEPHLQAIIGSTQDITEHKLSEQRLKNSYTELHHIINNTDDPIWSVDNEMKLTVFNQAFAGIVKLFFGFNPQPGQHFFDAIIENGNPDQTECRNHFRSALNGKKIRFERNYSLGNQTITMDYTISPLFNSEGLVTGATCFGRNITPMVQIHQQLEQQNHELQKANREMDRFVYSMSHDLRSPVASALGLIQVMELETEDANTLNHIFMLKKRISRLDALIENILDFVKQRKEEFKPEVIDITGLIEFIMESRGYKDEVPDMEISIQTDADVPVATDKSKLTTVIENLISNAIKYRDSLKEKLKLEIRCTATAGEVVITVKDNGIGIADKYKEKIFDMFFRASNLSQGSGLGLYIVKENLESMQGSIHVDSLLMEGSVFTIRFKNHYQPHLINLTDEPTENRMDY